MLRRQRLAIALRIVIPLLPIALLLLWWFDPPVPGATLEGNLVGLRTVQSIYPGPPRFVVEIESGATVITQSVGTLPYEAGRRVVLQEAEGMVFGGRTYRVLRYADQ